MKTRLTTLFILLGFIAFLPQGVEAKTTTWNSIQIADYEYYWNNGQGGATGWSLGLTNPNVAITYGADVYNMSTGGVIVTDGSTVSVGTILEFRPKAYADSDISWFGTGSSQDSPNGHWLAGAPTSGGCLNQDFVNSANDDIGNTHDVYIPLSVDPPANGLTFTGTTATLTPLGGTQYRVDGGGTVIAQFNFNATYGKFYYSYKPTRLIFSSLTLNKCYNNNVELRRSNQNTPYTLDVPQQVITYTLSVPSSNNPPNAPTISGPTSGNTSVAYSYTFTATDPDNDTVRYGVDWNFDGVVDEWVPATGYVSSGTGSATTHSWSTAGAKNFQALTQDSRGASSGWVSYTVTVSTSATVPTPLLTTSPSTIASGSSSTLQWTCTNGTSASITNVGAVSPATGGSVSVSPSVTTTYTLTCTNSIGSATDTTTVTVTPASAGPATACTVSPSTLPSSGGTVTYSANPSGGASAGYTWTPSDGWTFGSFYPSTTRTFTGAQSGNTYGMSVQASQGASTLSNCPSVSVGATCSGTKTGTITAAPARVKSGTATILTVSNVTNVQTSCVVTGPGVSQTIPANSCTVTGTTINTPAIVTQSTYLLTCDGTEVSRVIVNVLPRFVEF